MPLVANGHAMGAIGDDEVDFQGIGGSAYRAFFDQTTGTECAGRLGASPLAI